MIADADDVFDVTIVLKNGVSQTFRMTEFTINDHSLGRSVEWKTAPFAARLLHVDPDEIVMAYYAKVGAA